jgi:hypothetical protein
VERDDPNGELTGDVQAEHGKLEDWLDEVVNKEITEQRAITTGVERPKDVKRQETVSIAVTP